MPKVEHDDKRHKFTMELGRYEASLMYAEEEKVLDFYHLYVPVPYRGRDIESKILAVAFEYADKEGFRVVPSCPYILSDFLPKHPEWERLVRPGEFPFMHEGE